MQMYKPVGRPIRRDFKYGDLGQGKMSIPVSSVEQMYQELKEKVNFCSKPKQSISPVGVIIIFFI